MSLTFNIRDLSNRPWLVCNFGVAAKLTSGLGTLYLTAALRQSQVAAEYLNLAGQDVPDSITYRAPPGVVVALNAIAGLPLQRCLSVARSFRANRPDSTLVWGGPACTFYADAIDQSGLADIIVQGEGEPFARAVGGQTVTGLRVRSCSNSIVVTTPVLTDLDSLPVLPRWVSPTELVYAYDRFGVTVRAYDAQLSRGCWGKCRFCYVGNTGYRCRSARHFQEELSFITDQDVDFVRFLDDTFPLSESVLATLEHWVGQRRNPVGFFCELRVEQLQQRELLARFSNIGLTDIFVGAESGDTAELERLGKNLPVDALPSCIAFVRGLGVNAFVGLLLNLPAQTTASLANTLRLALLTEATAFYPVFARRYPGLGLTEPSTGGPPSVGAIAQEEWLELGANCTTGISDDCLFEALIKLKTLPLVKKALRKPLCDSLASIVPSGRRDVHVENARLCIEVNGAVSADEVRVDRLCPDCCALFLWAIAESNATPPQRLKDAALAMASHTDYHIRALSLWVLLRRPTLLKGSAVAALACADALRHDVHALVRCFARRLSCRLQTEAAPE
jgi:radical SAM superfamily enzyme YgiQ (UPF0313 family)